jgi:hypothetical protein
MLLSFGPLGFLLSLMLQEESHFASRLFLTLGALGGSAGFLCLILERSRYKVKEDLT